jgi:6-phosphogluconate dehydrogenase
MEVGIIGIGKRGFNLALLFKNKGYNVVVHDTNEKATDPLKQDGIKVVNSIKDFVESLSTKRVVWLMIPEGKLMDGMLNSIKHYLSVSDIIIAGEDSSVEDLQRRAREMEALQIDFLDCKIILDEQEKETSLRIGGNRFAFNYCEPLFKDIVANGSFLYTGRSGSSRLE